MPNTISQTEIENNENNVLEPQNCVINEISEDSEINDILKDVGLEEDEQTKEVLKILMTARGGSSKRYKDIHKRIREISKSIRKVFLDIKNEFKAQKEIAKEVEKLIKIFIILTTSFKRKIKEILQSLTKSEREIDVIIDILSDDSIDKFNNVDKEALSIQIDILKSITESLNSEFVKEREQNEKIMKRTEEIKEQLEEQRTKHEKSKKAVEAYLTLSFGATGAGIGIAACTTFATTEILGAVGFVVIAGAAFPAIPIIAIGALAGFGLFSSIAMIVGYLYKKQKENLINNLNTIITELNQLYTLSSQIFNSYDTVDSTSKNLLQEIDILNAKKSLENSRLRRKNAKIAISIKQLIETNISTLNEILNLNIDNWVENTALTDKLDSQETRLAIGMPSSE